MTNSAAMMHSKHLVLRPVLTLAGLASLVLACGGPTVKEAAEEFLPPFCEKFRSCNQAAFDRAYSSTQACVDKGLSGLNQDDLDKRSACDDDELTTCKNDINALDCSSALFQAGDISQLPASCKKC